MGFEIRADGLTEISEALEKLAENAPKAAAQALYEGAGLMANEVSKSAETIKTAPFKWASSRRGETRMPSPEEKEIVMAAAAGIAKFDKNGTEINTSVGFRNAGYAQLKGKTVPIPMIVNAINSGTSFMKKQPFFRKAATKAAPKAVKAMTEKINSVLAEYLDAMSKI